MDAVQSEMYKNVGKWDTGSVLANPVLQGMPLLKITVNKTDPCYVKSWETPLTASECVETHFANLIVENATNATTKNGRMVFCTNNLCDLGHPLRFPKVTADLIERNYGWLTTDC